MAEKGIAIQTVYSILFSPWDLVMGDTLVIFHLIKLHITIEGSYHTTLGVGLGDCSKGAI